MEQAFEAVSARVVGRPTQATAAALSANLVGIGLARFARTPLIPVLIAAGWFTPSAAVSLGAANLAGYLAGALAFVFTEVMLRHFRIVRYLETLTKEERGA